MSAFTHVLGSPLSARTGAAVAVASLALLLAACGAKDGQPAAAPPGGGMPPPEVAVITIAEQEVALQTELPGRVEPIRVAQVRARVNGVVLKRLFREGSEVKAGQALFKIDPAPYQASYESAVASLARAQANLTQATAQAERYKPLVEANAVSKQDYVNTIAAQKQAEADVAAGKAAVASARINLGYATVTSPISGRIGRALVTEGALVSAAEATQLAVVQQISTVYVNFTQSNAELLRLRRAVQSGQLQSTGDGAVPVRVVLDDGTELSRPGRLLFSDLSVDSTTGQITLRAEVPNPDNLLLPGQYVRVRLSQATLPAGIVVPQQAVTRGSQGDSVIVVGPDGKPAPRQVKLGTLVDGGWIVQDGLKPGEQVIVEGFQKMMVPGAPVKPVPWTRGASAPAGAAAPASGPAPAASAASAQQGA